MPFTPRSLGGQGLDRVLQRKSGTRGLWVQLGSVGSGRVCGYWLNKARGEAVDEGQDWTEKTQVGS